jgi:Zn-dependent peptidase ImmA (M78 family)
MDQTQNISAKNLADLIRGNTKDDVVDVVQLAKSLGLEVYPEELADKESGYLKFDSSDNGCYIVVNKSHPTTRQRFTIAHEVGHYLKHRDELVKCGQLDRKKGGDTKLEDQADELAAEILMPEDLVRKYVDEYVPEDDGKTFTANVIMDIANHYRVSAPMAITRLRALNYRIPYVSFA